MAALALAGKAAAGGRPCVQECGVAEKLAHDLSKRVAANVRKLGWADQLKPSAAAPAA